MEKWPIWKRASVGNCPFCWGSAWGPHGKECEERQKDYQEKKRKRKGRLTGLVAVSMFAIFLLAALRVSAEEFGGIGLEFFIVTTSALDGSNVRHMYYVQSAIPGTPAGKTDIGLGGQIIEVDGKEVDDKNPDAVRDAIRGPVGTSVRVRVFRQKWDNDTAIPTVILERKEYTFIRAVINVPDEEK